MFTLLCLIMIIPGIMVIIPGATIGPIINYFHITKSVGGLLTLVYFISSIIGIFSIGKLTSILSSRKIIFYACLLLSISTVLFLISKNFYLSLFFYFFVGIAAGMLITFPGSLVTYIKGKNSELYINVLFFLFSLGVVSTPLIVSFMMERGVQWQWTYLLPASYSFLVGLFSIFVPLPDIKKKDSKFLSQISSAIINYPLFIFLMTLSVFLYVGSEHTVNVWISKYMVETYPGRITYFQASRILTFIWIGIVIGRLISILVLKKTGSFVLLVLFNFLAFLIILIGVSSKNFLVSRFSFSLLGLGFSSMFPLLVSFAGKVKAEFADCVFSILLFSGQVGGALIPYLVALIADISNFRSAFFLLPFCHIVIFVLIIKLYRISYGDFGKQA